MGPTQGIQGHQAIQTLNNDTHGSTGGDSSSSYISSSGVKSVLLNAWSAVKSVFSDMLSSFGRHLSGQQGSDKPGREIAMDMSSRPAQRLPGMDVQLENGIYESSGENIYDSVYEHTGFGCPKNIYASVDDSVSVRDPVVPAVPTSPRPSLSELYSEPLYEEIVDTGIQDPTPPPIPTSPRPSLSGLPGRDAESEEMESVYQSSDEDIYTEPYDSQKASSTPENDPRGENDYDTPWKSYSDK